MNKIKRSDVEKELIETKELMLNTLPEKLAQIEVTEDDLKKLKDLHINSTEIQFNEAVETFHIGKRLTAIIQDKRIVDQIDEALEYLDKCKTVIQ